MGIERTLADRKGRRDFCELPRETITSSNSRRNRRRQKKMPPVQKLFDTCKDVFASGGTGIVPPPQDIDTLKSVLGTRFSLLLFFILFYFIFLVSNCVILLIGSVGCVLLVSKFWFGMKMFEGYVWFIVANVSLVKNYIGRRNINLTFQFISHQNV